MGILISFFRILFSVFSERKRKRQLESMQTAIILKLSIVIVGAVVISFFVFYYANDKKMDLMNKHHQARFEKLESTVSAIPKKAPAKMLKNLKETTEVK